MHKWKNVRWQIFFEMSGRKERRKTGINGKFKRKTKQNKNKKQINKTEKKS